MYKYFAVENSSADLSQHNVENPEKRQESWSSRGSAELLFHVNLLGKPPFLMITNES